MFIDSENIEDLGRTLQDIKKKILFDRIIKQSSKILTRS